MIRIQFRHWPILWKILSISVISVTAFIVVSLLYFLPMIEGKMREGKKQGIRSVVEVAFTLLEYYERQVEEGRLSVELARREAARRIGELRYDRDQYFWINDLDMTMIMHPIRTEFNGQNMTDFKDSTGHLLFRDFVAVSKQKGAGFVSYRWPKPGGQDPVPKISYVKLFQPWGWILGSGIYLDDIDRDLSRLRHDLLVGTVFFACGTLALAMLIGSGITRPLRRVMHGLDLVAAGRSAELEPQVLVDSHDEVGRLGERFNRLMDSVKHLARFKKVIEEEETLPQIYQRLGRLVTDHFDFDSAVLFEVDKDADRMNLVYPPPEEEMASGCEAVVLEQARFCKVRRTGHVISNLDYPEICHCQSAGKGKGHYCIPMLVSGGVTGVVNVGFALPDNRIQRLKLETRLAHLEQYVRESLSVIESKKLLEALRQSALLDPLTGLHNRRYLQEYTEGIVAGLRRRGRLAGLLMCDIDYFKQVNDVHGHHMGDLVLKETAAVIRQCVRQADIVVRFGGEEFLVILLDVEAGQTEAIGEKIRSRVEASSFILDREVLSKTISVGASEFPADAQTLWHCIKFADVALYRAKEQGRNRVVRFEQEMWQGDEF
ncbi:diguanylate cyclase [Geothermobacter hydrogeniphilus]|uniref:diguanylate cyclase n=1 Tax=Geothermobacter hydrogeniphilus TaxID=1969733 RepID=A0A1X0Y3I6_9BACT|nr:diguanylate cyclase [Geothermobacter hydrogeniphilus]ORJ59771.1 hypothetical protein B5V00_08825 [Geothermobacter hydrogeniphilus]